ncbi:uncharacterized protein LOC134827592 [Culicoides brevitarsis]|uniref:uncharacterized protein LOC134827592 n=1 Tax=Culicoides brevitarsis TaxID=469753 RepID=UPI00307C7FF0
MAIGEIPPENVVQLRTERIDSEIAATIEEVTVAGEELFKCWVKMLVKVKEKDSEIAQRQILDLQRRMLHLNETYPNIKIKLEVNKGAVRHQWSYKRLRHDKKMGFNCQFSFSVVDKERDALRATSQDILKHIEKLMVVYYEDQYDVKYRVGTRTKSESSDDTVEIKNNPDGAGTQTENDTNAILPLHSHDPHYHINSDAGNIHFEDKSKKKHYHICSCFNTGRKEGKGCFSMIFGVFKSCIPCLKKI